MTLWALKNELFGLPFGTFSTFWAILARTSFRSAHRNATTQPNEKNSKTPPKPRSASQWRDLWGPGKSVFSERSVKKHEGKRSSGETAKTEAVRKGELLRGKVSEGRPHPLRHSVKVEGQRLDKKKRKLSVKLSVVFFLGGATRSV